MAAAAVLSHALDPASLRHARRAAGLTQDDAGAVVGCTGATVSRYESGDIDPSASVLGILAGLYGVGVGAFYTTSPRMQ